MLEALLAHYKHVYFWPQSSEDRDYFAALDVAGIRCIPPSLAAYDHFLENEEVDYAGLRLHGGIRALQKHKRTLIVAVDNRAAEIGSDTGLPIIARNDLDALADWIGSDQPTSIQIPVEAIAAWRRQFFYSSPKVERGLNSIIAGNLARL